MAIIIARGGSKSIPRKNVLSLHGKPLVAWPIDLATSVDRVDRIVVSTDDDEIMDIAKQYGAEVPFKRPAKLAQDETETLPVVQHCLSYFFEKEHYRPGIVLLLYPTAPFLKKARIEKALDLFEQKQCNSVMSIVEDWGRFWRLDEFSGRYVPLHPEKRVNRQYYTPLYREDGAVYFNRYDVIMKKGAIIDEANVEFLVMEEGENIDIDEPQDFKQAERKKISS